MTKPKGITYENTCLQCNSKFTTHLSIKKYCSVLCRKKYLSKKYGIHLLKSGHYKTKKYKKKSRLCYLRHQAKIRNDNQSRYYKYKNKILKYKFKCPVCKSFFLTNLSTKKYCSLKCKRKEDIKKYRAINNANRRLKRKTNLRWATKEKENSSIRHFFGTIKLNKSLRDFCLTLYHFKKEVGNAEA